MRLQKLSVFVLDTADLLPEEKIRTEPKRRKELARFADFLSKYAVSQMFCMPAETVRIKKHKSGAPFLPDYPGFGISKSYSGRYAVCALSASKVGIDVEKLRVPNKYIARKYFTFEELHEVFRQSDKDTEDYDYIAAKDNIDICRRWTELWTVKEAYGKFEGTGLAGLSGNYMPTRNVCIMKGLRINKISLEDEYICTVLAEDDAAQIYRLTDIGSISKLFKQNYII